MIQGTGTMGSSLGAWYRILSPPLCAVVLSLLAACGSSGPAYMAPGPDIAATVEMTSQRAFSPAEVTVQVGDKVEWRNTSGLTHTVTGDPRVTADPAHVELPEGARPFNSAAMPPAQVFRYTFTVPGTYRYVCLPHEGQEMFGTVVVEPKTWGG
jgi:plastocyanin